MSYRFPKWTNKIHLFVSVGVPIVFIGLICFIWYYFSPDFLNVGYQPEQPIPFSHKLHAGTLGIDCRYCHTTVEKSPFAAVPTVETCVGCHDKVKKDSPRLKPLWDSVKNNTSIPWVRLHFLPRYSHFDHSVHLNAAVGCVSCHGRIDKMDIVTQAEPLNMGWCLDCHRNPEPYLRSKDQITNMSYVPTKEEQKALFDHIEPPRTACGACHY